MEINFLFTFVAPIQQYLEKVKICEGDKVINFKCLPRKPKINNWKITGIREFNKVASQRITIQKLIFINHQLENIMVKKFPFPIASNYSILIQI